MERSGPNDEVIKCMMPLTIGDAQLDEALDILEKAIVQEYGAVSQRQGESLYQTTTNGTQSIEAK